MKTQEPRTIYLKDYRPAPYLIDETALDIKLQPNAAEVASRLSMRPNPAYGGKPGPLVLDGEKLKLLSVAIDGKALPESAYEVRDAGLAITSPPDEPFILEITSVCDPEANKALSGLYRSGTLYCTQCEPEGFRRITYYLDRPDVLSRFRVRIEGDLKDTPVLLSNGNLVEEGKLPRGRHFAVWDDPFPKPSYLFALVGGKLGHVADSFTTKSGRKVELRVYCEPGKEDRCGWAMESLKRSMKWDEDRFGLEYDLDIFMIVAVSDFNMGAMENKGLNIFNDKLILASPDTATDGEYEAIEAVIGHEYFHNWTGNRITCRDWFQLCLKEGLTVFRDAEFTSDLRSRGVKRIQDVWALRTQQFAEDGGPLAHPVRPESFIEINNFYTRTVYEKGAELCGMIMTIVGPKGFRKGIDLYFKRHDGTAATVEDFIAAMADANKTDLSQFMLWYSQAGTPELTCRITYSEDSKTARLTVKQEQRPTPGQPKKKPLHIPFKMGLLNSKGKDFALKLEDGTAVKDGVLHLRKRSESFTFTGIGERPVASLLRGFSAPVKLEANIGDRDLEFLIAHDSDQFNRWQSAQTLAMKALIAMTASVRAGEKPRPSQRFAKALALLVADESLEPHFRAAMLMIPSARDIALAIGTDIDPEAIYQARRAFRESLGKALKSELETVYEAHAVAGDYSPDAASAGKRALRNAALSLLTVAGGRSSVPRLRDHYKQATNMTDAMAALELFGEVDAPAREAVLQSFYKRWRKDPLVLDKWFSTQARSPMHGTAEFVAELTRHPQFSMKNPNRVRAVIAAFAGGNQLQFNAADGKGYKLVADAVLELDGFNSLMAARLLGNFEMWRMLEPTRQKAARKQLERVAAAKNLSRDVFEIAGKMLKDPEN
ncbi:MULTISPECIES: aminopeptidase N [Rhodomicrobium]|uniref:aminopeptidase N n=1 Tax=Rhodomicrobium TaxID=1068 RepID=UPI000B4C0059|nr:MULTISPECIES: aminopeptidase N [Rhodomicrobium]